MPDNDSGANAGSGSGEKPRFETSTPPPKPSGLPWIIGLGALFAVLVLAALFLTPPGQRLGRWLLATAADALSFRAGSPAAGIEVGPLVLSAGLTGENKPAQPGTVFSVDELKDQPLALYAEFSKAVPGETVFRVRWSIAGTISDSSDLRVSHAQAAIAVSCPRSVPPGVHKVDLYVNGGGNSSATFTVTEGPVPGAARTHSMGRTKLSAKASSGSSARPKTYQVEQRVVLQEDGTIAPAPAPQAAPARTPVPQPQRAETKKYLVTHRHRFGSCTGTLELQGQNIVFHSRNVDEGVREFPIDTITPIKDGFASELGEKFHFTIENRDVDQVIREWMAGH